MSKQVKEEDMIAQQLESLKRQQSHMDNQLSIIIRLLNGDSTLNTLRPTGLVNDFKEMDERLKNMQKNTHDLVTWWNDRSKRKYIINVDLVNVGKVVAWIIATVAGFIGLIKWLTSLK